MWRPPNRPGMPLRHFMSPSPETRKRRTGYRSGAKPIRRWLSPSSHLLRACCLYATRASLMHRAAHRHDTTTCPVIRHLVSQAYKTSASSTLQHEAAYARRCDISQPSLLYYAAKLTFLGIGFAFLLSMSANRSATHAGRADSNCGDSRVPSTRESAGETTGGRGANGPERPCGDGSTPHPRDMLLKI
jgi:hypothetical protein